MTSKAKERKVSIQKDFLFQKMANLFKSWDDPAQILSIHFVENVIPSNSLLPCQQKKLILMKMMTGLTTSK